MECIVVLSVVRNRTWMSMGKKSFKDMFNENKSRRGNSQTREEGYLQ